MKICVVAQRIPFPPNKGEKLRSYHQIKHLVQQGHQVEVLSFSENEADILHARQLSENLNIPVKVFALPGKLQRYLWALMKGQALSVGAFYSRELLTFLATSLKQRFDLLYLTASSLVYYAKSLRENGHEMPAMMVDFMDVDSDKWSQYAGNAGFPMRQVYQRESHKVRHLERYATDTFDATFLIAQEEIDLFSRTVSNRGAVTVLGNGMAFDDFYPPEQLPEGQPPVFLFTGVMDYKPNIDAVVWFTENCWQAILAQFPDSEFYIVGMNPTKPVEALSQQQGITVTGFVDDILPYYHRATSFVAPFRLARGVQNKVLQAVASGIPVITTSMGAEGIDFAGHDSMWLVDDVNAFVEACLETVTNRPLALEKARLALSHLTEHYSWAQKLQPLDEAIGRL